MGAHTDTSRAESGRQLSGRVLVTGATGFLGQATADALSAAGHAVVRGARATPGILRSGDAWTGYGEIGPETRWDAALDGVETIVHVAGLAHEDSAAYAETLARVNAGGTASLAKAAIPRGVRRFILISSIGVNGPVNRGSPFTEDDEEHPDNSYAQSKLDAENLLKEIARGTPMQWVVLRPPMVYGAGARGNFRRLVRLVRTGMPLPLGCATAPRSIIGVDNLTSAIGLCVEHPLAANKTFLVSDAEVTSTVGLIHGIAAALGRRAYTPRVPASLLRMALTLAGRERDFRRLFDPLEIDSQRIRKLLGWSPPVSLEEGLRRATVVTPIRYTPPSPGG